MKIKWSSEDMEKEMTRLEIKMLIKVIRNLSVKR